MLRTDEGDSFELHAWDTVKGADFLADQDVVDRFVHASPEEIMLLDHWGIPWTRDKDGRLDQRPFGGHSYPRATLAADKTGFFEMQTLYDTLLKYQNFTRYDEFFVTDILLDGDQFTGMVGIDATSGELVTLQGKALLIAAGGAGTLFGFTTYSQSVTGDGLAMAYRAGMPLEDMEFIQFHPTGLVPSGILMTEGCRGEGGFLRNAEGERFLERYAPEKMELGPRDVISRAETTEILEGRGFKGEDGMDYLHLDLTHLGADRINTRLPLIREVSMKFVGIDPIDNPIPIRPVAHYSMGGIETDIDGATRTLGVWAAGEAACVSLHGANRLGSNSTAECLVWGGIAGQEIADKLDDLPTPPPLGETQIASAHAHVDEVLARKGDQDLYALRQELRGAMDKHVGVYRSGEGLAQALDTVREIKERRRGRPSRTRAGSTTRTSSTLWSWRIFSSSPKSQSPAPWHVRSPEGPTHGATSRTETTTPGCDTLSPGAPGRSTIGIQTGDHHHVEAGRTQVLRGDGRMLDTAKKPSRRHPNRLGIYGWFGGGRWGPDRYLYTLHRVTGLGLLTYFLVHIVVTSSRALGPGAWEDSMARVSGPLFYFGEFLVFVAFAFHAINGVGWFSPSSGWESEDLSSPSTPTRPSSTCSDPGSPRLSC